jgi:ring-1,2-phenylacetyl-CoA epoxidase subunit PaaD
MHWKHLVKYIAQTSQQVGNDEYKKGEHLMEEEILRVLQMVKDPEIDSISIVDLGMVHTIEEFDNGYRIELLPTFVGCPALDIIQSNVKKTLFEQLRLQDVEITYVYHPPWTSDHLTEKGRDNLKKFGISPPPREIPEEGNWEILCPFCDSAYTSMENLFGPTACRSILYCKHCKNPFEAMKPISTMM